MRQYLNILRTPHVTRLFAASLLARLPMGINGLAIVLMVKAETGSFGTAGAAAGALALGTGLCAPLTARLIDALGSRMLMVLAAICSAALVAAAFVAGGAFPPTSSVLRAQYPRLFGGRPELLQGAFALDSVLTESIFTVAPLLTAALVVVFEPAAAILVSAAAVLCGTAALVSALPPGAGDAAPRADRSGGLGALAVPGIRTLVASMLPVGFAFGSLEVALPAFADHEGRPELAGVLVALWALGSVAGGLAYGARPRRGTLSGTHLRIAVLLPLSFLPLALASSPAVMALLVIPAGVLIAPLIATRNELAGEVAPAGARTEAYTWPLTALVGGIALGAAAAGAIADAAGWQTAVLVAAAAAACGTLVSAGRRATLAPAAS
jgi:MFS family permease